MLARHSADIMFRIKTDEREREREREREKSSEGINWDLVTGIFNIGITKNVNELYLFLK